MSTNQVNLNIDELKGFVNHIINNNRYLQKQGKNPVSIEVIGESGIGKTSSILQLANETGLNFVKLNLAQIEELGDLVGFPMVQFELVKAGENQPVSTHKEPVYETKKIKKQVPKEIKRMDKQLVQELEKTTTTKRVLEDGKFVTKEVEIEVPKMIEKEVEVTETVMEEIEVEEKVLVSGSESVASPTPTGETLWLDKNAAESFLKKGYEFTGRNRMSYSPPEWIANKTGGGILILDDWNRADIRFIQAVMELVDRQEYISWKLPQDWHIILTANPDNGDYLVNSIDTAQRTRFISVNLKFDVQVWAKWAETEQIDTRCINFMLMHPEFVDKADKINARSVTNFFNSISSIDEFEKNLPLIQMIGEGSVGSEFSSMFTSFINNKLDKMLTPQDILLHDNESYIMGQLRNTIGRDKDYRPDIASIIATRIINFSLVHAEKVGITQKELDRLTRIVTDPDTMQNDIKYHIVKKLLNGNKQKFQKMMTNPEVVKMSMK